MVRSRLLPILLCCLISAGAAAGDHPLAPIEIAVGPHQRSLRLFAPDGLGPGAPLLLLFHGSSDSGAGFRRGTGGEFDRLAAEHGFAVAYLDGYKGNWNDCRLADPFPARTEQIDDIAFVEAVIRLGRERLGSDPRKVLAVGFSNGASMVYRLALERPDLVAGIAAIGGNLPARENMICREAGKPVAALILSGTEDPLVPYQGGDVTIFGRNSRGRVISSEESAAYFARLNGLDEDPREEDWPVRVDDGTRIRLRDWAAPGKPPVELLTVVGGGHVVPQAEFRFPAILGRQSANLDAPLAVWDFFERALAVQPPLAP